jgi:hypothetical protein
MKNVNKNHAKHDENKENPFLSNKVDADLPMVDAPNGTLKASGHQTPWWKSIGPSATAFDCCEDDADWNGNRTGE